MEHDNACVVIPGAYGLVLGVSRGHTQRWGLPGGKREGNETPIQTAVRELYEETGLLPVSLSYVITTVGPGGKTAVYLCKNYRGTLRSSAEGKTSWISWSELFGPPFGEENRQICNALIAA